mmetsp:Transcript_52466/g.102664  ORF Transcript_52466/g.102664 Transcript_52466/m.102664 type:complete len:212 (+) Transcript_52466:47-682(+)
MVTALSASPGHVPLQKKHSKPCIRMDAAISLYFTSGVEETRTCQCGEREWIEDALKGRKASEVHAVRREKRRERRDVRGHGGNGEDESGRKRLQHRRRTRCMGGTVRIDSSMRCTQERGLMKDSRLNLCLSIQTDPLACMALFIQTKPRGQVLMQAGYKDRGGSKKSYGSSLLPFVPVHSIRISLPAQRDRSPLQSVRKRRLTEESECKGK